MGPEGPFHGTRDFPMTSLRLTPDDYRAIAHAFSACRLGRQPPHAFRKKLAAALGPAAPALAERVRRFRSAELRLLQSHLAARGPAQGGHGLAAAELDSLAEAFGPFLFHALCGRWRTTNSGL